MPHWSPPRQFISARDYDWGNDMAKIYLVDDDENILTSVSMFLEAEGYEFETFNEGHSALEALQKSPPDMAVFDVKMPRMDGLELLRRLRQSSNLPVIFLTSKDDEIDEAITTQEEAVELTKNKGLKKELETFLDKLKEAKKKKDA